MDELKTIEQLNLFIERIKEMGIEVRHELLDGAGAGICELKGYAYLFLDMSCGPAEQLEAIRKALPDMQASGANANE